MYAKYEIFLNLFKCIRKKNQRVAMGCDKKYKIQKIRSALGHIEIRSPLLARVMLARNGIALAGFGSLSFRSPRRMERRGRGGCRTVAIAVEEDTRVPREAPLAMVRRRREVAGASRSRAWLRLVGGPALSRRYPVMPSNHGQPLTITVKYDFERSQPRDSEPGAVPVRATCSI